MLHITLICIGKLKEKYWTDACKEYLKRMTTLCRFEIIELPESVKGNPAACLEQEAQQILKRIPERSEIIALCVEGKAFSSEGFAAYFDKCASTQGAICFIIGSSEGLSERVKEIAGLKLSFSLMTYPHQMMRIILLEQIYRAIKIIRGEIYHK